MGNPRYDHLTWYQVSPSGCWLWTGYINARGYGLFRHLGTHRLAHRYFYEGLVGPIPDGMVIDHICFVRHCVNPEHLQPLTLSENSKRQQSTLASHCANGHEFTEATSRQTNRGRVCRTCVRNRSRRYKARKRLELQSQKVTTTSAEFAARMVERGWTV